jgi:hypothetical protein
MKGIAALSSARMQAGVDVCHDHQIFVCKGAELRMKQTTLVSVLAAGLALFPVAAAFSAAPNPTPLRESKILADFETDVKATSDPTGSGTNLATINTNADFVGEGSKSLCVDLNGINTWQDNTLVIEFPQPIDIAGHQVLAMDVFLPLESLNAGDNSGTWWQFTPHLTLESRDDAAVTTESWLGMRNMSQGWNHLTFNLASGTDTKISKLTLVTNSNGEKSWTGPVYIDKIQVYKGNFVGLQPDEKLITGFDEPAIAEKFSGTAPVEHTTDKQFVQSGTGSLAIDLSGQGGGWTTDTTRADDLGVDVDLSKATAIHLDVYVPTASHPALEGWEELGIVVVGENGEVWGSSSGFVSDQWQTLEIPLTAEQAATLGHVKGLYFIRNQGANSGDDNPWSGKVYVDNFRAAFAEPQTAGQ